MLTYDIKKRVRELVLQVAEEMGIKIENGVVSSDHVHIFANIPPHIKISEFVQKAKGRSSKRTPTVVKDLILATDLMKAYQYGFDN